jgi:tetratricopeptide (TPR) repeat protein/predicted Ser/Thr protein kinase
LSANRERLPNLFAEACRLDGAARAAFLASECGADTALRGELEELLRLDVNSRFLGEAELTAMRVDLGESAAVLPERIGSFEVLGLLGRGGMGVVYRARQEQPAREVALKVLAPGLADGAGKARFAMEAEALGRLQHPGIAQIHEAGTYRSAAGEQPYLAMELVSGVPLHVWASARRPDLATRLGLLIEICEAVHHAHQKGLIHRDLKPGNVLVDAADHPKVLDFGIARFVAEDPSRTLQTLTGQVLGTLAYMSPEQASGQSSQIDIRTDVYALGVIGYELLAGALPIELTDSPVTGQLQRLATVEPTPLGQHDRRLRGDLQTIFAMALRKEPERRYDTAQALADDLRRHLAHEPIRARPATTAYVLTRFARRHALLLVAVVASILGLAVALVASLRATARVERALLAEGNARAAAEQAGAKAARQVRVKSAVLEFLADVIRAVDPIANPSARHSSLAQHFRAAALGIDARFHEDLDIARAVKLEVARAQNGLGDAAAASALLAPLWAELPKDADFELAHAIGTELARAQWSSGALDDALRTIAGLESRIDAQTGSDAVAMGFLKIRHEILHGEVLFARGRLDEAEERWQHCLRAGEGFVGFVDSALWAIVHVNLAGVFHQRGEAGPAAAAIDRAVLALERVSGPDAEALLLALNTQATIAMGLGEHARAAELFDRVVASWSHVFGDDHPARIELLQNQASAAFRIGQVERAERGFAEAIALGERLFGRDTARLAPPLANLGNLRWSQGRPREAAEFYERAIALREAHAPSADKPLSGYLYDLARIRLELGDGAAHLALLERSLAVRTEALGIDSPLVLVRCVDLARHLARVGRTREAIDRLLAVDARLPERLGRDHAATIASARMLAELHHALGDAEQMERHVKAMLQRAAGTREEEAARELAERILPPARR